MHQALYRKWRPQTFDDVCGQEHITSILKYEVANAKFSHAYLFCGSRGTGKTTCAKILSRAVNCLDPKNGDPCGKCAACLSVENGTATDVLEMDAASNNGVDDIRDIRDEVIYSPSSLKYRVYIIDEVHMLSNSAFNALLKTLEEPPEHVIFVLATTELHKLPATIISRCQRFDFRRISTDVLKDRLMYIAKNEGIDIDEKAAVLIARQAQGGMRDAISLLELCAGSRRRIDEKLVHESIGGTGRGELIELCHAIMEKDYDEILGAVSDAVNSSRDLLVFWQELLSLYRDLLVCKISSRPVEYLDLTDSEYEALASVASKLTLESLSYHCRLIEDAMIVMQRSNSVKRIVAEMTLVRMCESRLSGSYEALNDRMSEIERRLSGISSNVISATEHATSDASAKDNDSDMSRPSRKQAPSYDMSDDEMFRSDAPPKAKEAKESKTQKSEKRTLRPFKSRAEVLDIFSRRDPMNASFIAQSKWYTDESGNIILRFEDQYMIDSIRTFDADSQFIDVVSNVMGKRYSKETVLFEVDNQNKHADLIDEIIENSEQ